MRRALVLLCLLVFTALPQAFASMAHASPSPFQHVLAAGDSAAPADCHAVAAHCDAEKSDSDPLALQHARRQSMPFYAVIWQAGPGALSEADVRPAMRPPRVRR